MTNTYEANVTPTATQTAEANVLNQAEAAQQANLIEWVGGVKVDPNYHYKLEQGSHKLTATPEHGLSYNFHVMCSGCAWEGRYLTTAEAEGACQEHLNLKFPRRG